MTDNEFILFDRIQKIRDTLAKYDDKEVCISYSGGKDSNVLSTLVDEALPGNKIRRVYSNTGLEYLQMVKFVKAKADKDDRFIILPPSRNVRQTLQEHGYPFKSKFHSNAVRLYQERGCTKSTTSYAEHTYKSHSFQCPAKLKYQFQSPDAVSFKISDKCCYYMKELPLDQYYTSQAVHLQMDGLRRGEEGRRKGIGCVSASHRVKGLTNFHPLAPVTEEWQQWYIREREREIELPPMYAYGFDRTGCRGCPFNAHLQRDLDIMKEHMPADYKAAEQIWKPVYAEYRRIGYRLRKEEQTTMDDLLKEKE